jgi:hypothetical protein
MNNEQIIIINEVKTSKINVEENSIMEKIANLPFELRMMIFVEFRKYHREVVVDGVNKMVNFWFCCEPFTKIYGEGVGEFYEST